MDDATIIDFTGRDAVTDPLTNLLRKGARELLQAAVEAERDAFLAEFAERRTSDGRAAVVGSGYHPERAVQTGIGPVTVKVPKVRAKDGKPVTFRSVENGGAKLDHGSAAVMAVRAAQKSSIFSLLAAAGGRGDLHRGTLQEGQAGAQRGDEPARVGAPFQHIARQRSQDVGVLVAAGVPAHEGDQAPQA